MTRDAVHIRSDTTHVRREYVLALRRQLDAICSLSIEPPSDKSLKRANGALGSVNPYKGLARDELREEFMALKDELGFDGAARFMELSRAEAKRLSAEPGQTALDGHQPD